MTRHPARLSAFGLACALALTGCAGTDASGASTSTSTSTAPGTATGSASASAAPAAGSQRIEVAFAGGQVSGDTGRVAVPVGTSVTLVLTSDVTDEVHVHGYDLTAELVPGQPAELTFDATIPGVFEVELHEAGTLLVSLQVE